MILNVPYVKISVWSKKNKSFTWSKKKKSEKINLKILFIYTQLNLNILKL